ncbi:MAG: hypothetical protein IJZ35_01200 [Clostridia bacterium]|nr:hypothetical protein [Clostridia bacterium]
MRQEINLNEWGRKQHFEYYSKISTPHYCIAFNVDITNLLQFTRKHHISFYYSLIYLCTQSLNEIDEFLLEIEDNGVFRAERRVPCFTDLKKGETSFHMVSLPCEGDIIEFATKAREESANNPLPVNALAGVSEPQIIYSCIPWADITMCSNERDYNDPKLKDDTAPILVWGKYVEREGRYIINMTLDVNHRLIDGYFVGLFVQKLESKLAELE